MRPNEAREGPNEAREGPNEAREGPIRATVGNHWGHSGGGTARTHTTGTHQDPHHVTVPHYPGTHTTHAGSQCYHATSLRGQDRFTRLLSVTVRTRTYRLVQNHHFSEWSNGPVKTCTFSKKAYLILIVFTKKCIFDVFDEN